MAFELAISTPTLPRDLKTAWEQSFILQGFQVEIYPGFSPEQWDDGFLPFRVNAVPPALIGVTLTEPALAGFETSFESEGAHLRTPAGRSTLDFALQCIGGATLAQLCEGYYVDDQNGIVCSGAEALEAAISEITAFVASAGENEKENMPFPGWETVG